MIDRKIEENIKLIKSFIEYWMKFHGMYKDIIKKEIISKNDENDFLETMTLVEQKYRSLTDGFDFRYMPHNRMTDPVIELLSLRKLSAMSEDRLKKIEEDWRDSYVFLSNILERLENKKRRLERFSTVGVLIKRLFERKERSSI